MNGWFNSFQQNKSRAYTPIGSLLAINLLVYTYNGGLTLMYSVSFKTNICGLPDNPSGNLALENS